MSRTEKRKSQKHRNLKEKWKGKDVDRTFALKSQLSADNEPELKKRI